MPRQKLTKLEVRDMQRLREINIPQSILARHFDVTPAAVNYYCRDIEPLSIEEVLEILKASPMPFPQPLPLLQVNG